jgi:hypothetical protein
VLDCFHPVADESGECIGCVGHRPIRSAKAWWEVVKQPGHHLSRLVGWEGQNNAIKSAILLFLRMAWLLRQDLKRLENSFQFFSAVPALKISLVCENHDDFCIEQGIDKHFRELLAGFNAEVSKNDSSPSAQWSASACWRLVVRA